MNERRRSIAAGPAQGPPAAVPDAYVDSEQWRVLAEADTPEDFYPGWLSVQCARIDQVRRALILAEAEAEGTFEPVAEWPEGQAAGAVLRDVAQAALDDNRPVVVDLNAEAAGEVTHLPESVGVAYPLTINDRVACVVALEVNARSDAAMEAVMRELQWGAAWLEAMLRRVQGQEDEHTINRLASAMVLVTKAAAETRGDAAVSTLVTALASRLDCERVSCGFARRGRTRVAALSSAGQFGERMHLINAIGGAMDEALDQQVTINYPEDADRFVARRHRELSRGVDNGTVLSVPLMVAGRPYGAITLERAEDQPFDEDSVRFCETLASIIGPVFRDKRLNDRWLPVKIRDSLATQLGRLLGPRHLGRKAAAAVLAGAVGFAWFAHGDFRIAADAVLEGVEQRAVVAPFDGYVAAEHLRAGDRVEKGQEIARLDAGELRVELAELTSERAQALRRYNQARAEDERAEARIQQARVDQADARIARVQRQLEKTRLVAPIDGIIVSGDLSQSLGGAVERGSELFEVAPLDDYRITLKVDERDIAHVEEGQSGRLILSALSDRPLDLTVTAITPVTTASEGRNFFRVEAAIDDKPGLLRPGMEGVAKLAAGEQRYVWIWTRDLVNWLRLWWWRWVP